MKMIVLPNFLYSCFVLCCVTIIEASLDRVQSFIKQDVDLNVINKISKRNVDKSCSKLDGFEANLDSSQNKVWYITGY